MSRADHVAGAAAKLGKLVEIERCASSDELLEAAFSDAVSPAICTNEGATSHARWSRISTPGFAGHPSLEEIDRYTRAAAASGAR